MQKYYGPYDCDRGTSTKILHIIVALFVFRIPLVQAEPRSTQMWKELS